MTTTKGPHVHVTERHVATVPRDAPDRRGGGALPLIDRIGMDIGSKHSVEDGLCWAAAHGLHSVDFRLETSPEAFGAFTAERCAALRTRAEADGVTIGLHTPTVCLSFAPCCIT